MNEKLRLAQIFDVSDLFVPTKASIFLRRVGKNEGNSFVLSDSVVVDATNFLDIKQGINKFILNDEEDGFTGNGYLSLQSSVDSLVAMQREFPIVEYPIMAETEGVYYLWLRSKFLSGIGDISSLPLDLVDVLIDDVVVKTISLNTSDVSNWFWLNTEIVLPDKKQHTLGVRLRNIYSVLDKIIFNIDTGSSFDPFESGPPNSVSPYFTVHMNVHKVDDDFNILSQFPIYDFKNSISEVIQTDWYNFNIESWDMGTDSFLDYDQKAALIVSSSGTSNSNFFLWELVDNDEYVVSPSGLKI